MSLKENLNKVNSTIPEHVTLVAVSKTKPNEDLIEIYDAGQRVFGENKVQELCQKYEDLPKDIKWHMIGHLQSNKVKYIAPFVSLIHGIDTPKLLKEVSKQAVKSDRVIECLIQVFIAQEETKFGFSPDEVLELFSQIEKENNYPSVKIVGLMAMASHTSNEGQVKDEFSQVKALFDTIGRKYNSDVIEMKTLSMGMSGDYSVAMSCGSNMVRVGSSIFGQRNYIK